MSKLVLTVTDIHMNKTLMISAGMSQSAFYREKLAECVCVCMTARVSVHQQLHVRVHMCTVCIKRVCACL